MLAAERPTDRRSKSRIFTHMHIAFWMWLHRERVDTIEGICSDGLMADADGLLGWKPDERGAASNYRDLIVLLWSVR